jgi:hypothetical protein
MTPNPSIEQTASGRCSCQTLNAFFRPDTLNLAYHLNPRKRLVCCVNLCRVIELSGLHSYNRIPERVDCVKPSIPQRVQATKLCHGLGIVQIR